MMAMILYLRTNHLVLSFGFKGLLAQENLPLHRPFAICWRKKVVSGPAFSSNGAIHLVDMPSD
jgi:hypothetical protein